MIQNLLSKIRRSKPVPELVTITNAQAKQIEQVLKPPPKSRGRVIKETKHAEFRPNASRLGGRIVKTMPHKLQKVKQGQEKLGD